MPVVGVNRPRPYPVCPASRQLRRWRVLFRGAKNPLTTRNPGPRSRSWVKEREEKDKGGKRKGQLHARQDSVLQRQRDVRRRRERERERERERLCIV